MSNFYGKLPFAQNIASAMDFQNEAYAQQMGWELPCIVKSVSSDGLQVTVSFDIESSQYVLPNITIPIASSQYVRAPIQPGDTGITKKVDVDLTYIAGIQKGTANFATVGNLQSVLFFQPLTSTKWQANPDINALWLYGPDGVLIQDEAGHCIATIHKNQSDGITLVVGSNNVTINSSESTINFGSNYVKVNGSGVSIEGTLTINGSPYLGHTHGGVMTGTSATTGVIP